MGLIVAIYALAHHRQPGRRATSSCSDVLILATILAVGSYLAFIWALKLQIQVWPTFITG